MYITDDFVEYIKHSILKYINKKINCIRHIDCLLGISNKHIFSEHKLDIDITHLKQIDNKFPIHVSDGQYQTNLLHDRQCINISHNINGNATIKLHTVIPYIITGQWLDSHLLCGYCVSKSYDFAKDNKIYITKYKSLYVLIFDIVEGESYGDIQGPYTIMCISNKLDIARHIYVYNYHYKHIYANNELVCRCCDDIKIVNFKKKRYIKINNNIICFRDNEITKFKYEFNQDNNKHIYTKYSNILNEDRRYILYVDGNNYQLDETCSDTGTYLKCYNKNGIIIFKGMRCYYGTLYDTDGTILYSGCLTNNKYNRAGTFYKNGLVRYNGGFKYGKFHGNGTIYYPNGTYKCGKWDNGKLCEDSINVSGTDKANTDKAGTDKAGKDTDKAGTDKAGTYRLKIPYISFKNNNWYKSND